MRYTFQRTRSIVLLFTGVENIFSVRIFLNRPIYFSKFSIQIFQYLDISFCSPWDSTRQEFILYSLSSRNLHQQRIDDKIVAPNNTDRPEKNIRSQILYFRLQDFSTRHLLNYSRRTRLLEHYRYYFSYVRRRLIRYDIIQRVFWKTVPSFIQLAFTVSLHNVQCTVSDRVVLLHTL